MNNEETREEVMRKAGFLPVQLAAQLACVHSATIYRLIDEGKVEGQRIGRFRFVHASQLASRYPDPVRQRIMEGVSCG